MGVRTGFAPIDGIQIYYKTIGDGLPVVFIHGFTLDTRMWDDQVEAFAERHLVVRYDVRGFGRSSPVGTANYSPLDELKGLLDYLGLPSAMIVGLSMGGGIATSFAVAYPNATRALVAVDSALWGYRPLDEWIAITGEINRVARNSGPEAAKALWLANPLFAPALENPAVFLRLREIVGDYSGWHWLNENKERGMNPPTIERLTEIRVPSLIVLGERDIPDAHRIADIPVEKIPGARLITLPGSGRMTNMEAPRQFNEALLGFLAAI